MAEVISFSERKNNPEGIKSGDICQIKLKDKILSMDKVRVVSVQGGEATVRLLVGYGNNIDGLAWYKLEGGTGFSMSFVDEKPISLKYLKKVKPGS